MIRGKFSEAGYSRAKRKISPAFAKGSKRIFQKNSWLIIGREMNVKVYFYIHLPANDKPKSFEVILARIEIAVELSLISRSNIKIILISVIYTSTLYHPRIEFLSVKLAHR